MAEIELTSFEVSLQNLMTALEASDHDEAKHQIKELHPGEIALLFEAIQPKDRSILWPGIEISIQGEILKEVSEDVDTTIYFYNPNIHPFDEYELRKEENIRFAEKLGMPIIDADYDRDEWFSLALLSRPPLLRLKIS